MGRTIHFVYGLRPQREPFPLVHFLAVESARTVLRPERVLFHVQEVPHGRYWDRVRPHVELARIEPIPGVVERCVDPFVARYLYAHHADVVRLDALFEHGGLYLDIDTLTTADFPDEWWSAPFVLGREPLNVTLDDGRSTRSLLNAVMLAQPGATFARAWRDRIVEAMDGSWSAHSCELAARLADRMPDEVTVLPEIAFSRFAPAPAPLQALLMPSPANRQPDLTGAYVLHLCQHLWWDRERTDFLPWLAGADIDEAYIRDGLSVYARCARQFLPDDPPKAGATRTAVNVGAPPTTERICYVGHDGSSGYGVVAHRAVRAMRGAGQHVAWQPLYGGPDGGGWWRWWVGEPEHSADLGHDRVGGPCEVLIGHSPPDHACYYRDRYEPDRYVAHTVWETDRIPPSWVPLLNGSEGRVDAVVVPTEWNAATFRQGGVETPIYVVPHIAAPDALRSADADAGADLGLDLGDNDFVFYMVSVWSPRKSIELAVEAFVKAFTASDPVVLVIKAEARVQHLLDRSPPPANAPESFAWWHLMQKLRQARRPPRVVLVTEWWSDEQVAALHQRGDCYFALPHSEGWGLGAFDAVTLAKPVITTGWGGPLAYLGDDYPGLVSGRLVETTALGLDRPAHWFEPDVDLAVELLRDIVENRDRCSAARNALAERVTNECSPERVASLLAAACDLSRKRPARSPVPGPDAPSPRTR